MSPSYGEIGYPVPPNIVGIDALENLLSIKRLD